MSSLQQKLSQKNLSSQDERFWLEWVEAAFPDLDSRTYFLPPVHFNRVSMSRQSVAGQKVLVLHEAPGQAGQSPALQPTPVNTGQSTPGQTGLAISAQDGQSNQTAETAAECIHPEQGAQKIVSDVQPPAKKAGKIKRLAGRLENFLTSPRPRKIKESTAGLSVLTLYEPAEQAGESNQQAVNDVRSTDPQQKVGVQSLSKKRLLKIRRLAGSVGNLVTSPRSKKGQHKFRTFFQDSDVRDDTALQRILGCLQKMSEINGEVLVGLSQLEFGQYLGEPCYAAAAAQLPVPANLPSVLPENWKEGDFDVLLIHRHYGLVVCEVKAFGDNLQKLVMSQQNIDNNIRKKLKQAVSQLDKAEAMLSHLVSDVTPGLRITKTIAVPNLTARQVQQAISGDTLLTQDLCRCLGTTDPADITGMCLCSDQLSDSKTPWDVTSDVLRELGNWWQRCVAVSGPDSHMTCGVYKTLVARFCGPATAVTVPCTSPPRLCVKTLGHAVSWTGECYTAQINLFPEQVDLLNTAPSKVFVAGPPGTGKTVVLLLTAIHWLVCGNEVYIVSTWTVSLAACSMLYHLLVETVNKQQASVVPPGQPHLLQYDFEQGKDVKKAVNDLLLAVRGRSLYVIADEAVQSDDFQIFCDMLLKLVPDLRLWAASCYHGYPPSGWQVECLTRPLRCPPAVVREVQKDWAITLRRVVQAYSARGVADHTDGPPVRRPHHGGQGHSGHWPGDCVTCGRELASFLDSLRFPGNSTTRQTLTSAAQLCLQWKDVMVLYWYRDVSNNSGVVRGLREAGIPVQVMKDDDTEDVASARSDVVWVANGRRVHGLERKIVVCLDVAGLDTVPLHCMSRCTSQLVIVSSDH